MIMYNTLMGVAAGLALILVPLFAKKLLRGEKVSAEGWSLAFAILGIILTFLGGLMTVTWPLTANPPINIVFAEPNLVFGLLLLVTSIFLWKRKDLIENLDKNKEQILNAFSPISWVVFALGLILLSCTAAILRFNLVGEAPEMEPITGLLHKQPWIENTFFVILYGLSSIGALLTPFAVRNLNSKLLSIITICWLTAGVLFLAFSAMNYYTHIGMLINIQTKSQFKF